MPKKNQAKTNGFLLYANEIKNQLLKEGCTIRNTPDLIHSASPKWQVCAISIFIMYTELLTIKTIQQTTDLDKISSTC